VFRYRKRRKFLTLKKLRRSLARTYAKFAKDVCFLRRRFAFTEGSKRRTFDFKAYGDRSFLFVKRSLSVTSRFSDIVPHFTPYCAERASAVNLLTIDTALLFLKNPNLTQHDAQLNLRDVAGWVNSYLVKNYGMSQNTNLSPSSAFSSTILKRLSNASVNSKYKS